MTKEELLNELIKLYNIDKEVQLMILYVYEIGFIKGVEFMKDKS